MPLIIENECPKSAITSGDVVFITTANARNIVKEISPARLRSLNGPLYKRAIYVFGSTDKLRLLAIREFFNNPELFIKNYYVQQEVADTYRYVFPEKPPAYHSRIECDMLNSDFNNYVVPDFIQSQGRAAVMSYRVWFMANMYLIEDRWDYFQLRFKSEYGVWIQPEEVLRPNSGFTQMHNLDLKALEGRIDDLLNQAAILYRANAFNQEVICRWGKCAWLGRITEKPLRDNRNNLDEKAVRKFLANYDADVVQPLKRYLIEYYKVSANPDLSFSGRLLDQLGFHPCRRCFYGMA